MIESGAVESLLHSLDDISNRLSISKLRVYLEEILRWNPQLGLVSKRGTVQVVERLVRQSIALWDFVGEHPPGRGGPDWRIIDVGSGAGFPGVIWKLLEPAAATVLVERKARRAGFLERVAHRLEVTDLAVRCADIRELSREPKHRLGYDVAVFLAVAPPQLLSRWVAPLIGPDGVFTSVRPMEGGSEALKVVQGFEGMSEERLPHGRFVLYRRRPDGD